jgi:PadR family transcriptional regulator, regulatory protein PadR
MAHSIIQTGVKRMSYIEETVSNLQQELRRGAIILCVLSQLTEPKYGYALVESLEGKGIKIEPGTLYPLLRRLEKQELLTSEWETSGAKPRKYYILSAAGREVYRLLLGDWEDLVNTINKLTGKKE